MGDSRLAQLNRGSSGDQGVSGGPCRSRRKRPLSGEHVPDRLGELAGDLHPSDLGPALGAESGAGVLVVVTVEGMAGGVAWVAASISAQRSQVGPFLASGPRWSRLPDWYTRGHSPV
jgi:hypothetical protein